MELDIPELEALLKNNVNGPSDDAIRIRLFIKYTVTGVSLICPTIIMKL